MKVHSDQTWWNGSTISFALLLTLLIFIAGFPVAGNAQMQTTTGISGTVTDSSGAVIPGAAVEVKEQNTGATFHATTNGEGIYSFPLLLPGLYTITVTSRGFQREVVTDRTVLAAQPAAVDVRMRIGATAETVTVSAAGAELLNTESQTISGTITPLLVDNIPTIRGNFMDLLALSPGVVPQTPEAFNGGLHISQTEEAFNYVVSANTYNASGVFMAGNRDSADNVSIDGANVQDPVYEDATQMQPTDSVKELRVETANMNAEFGYGVSGINVITKNGSNQFHGDVYEYLRNNHLDANLFFSNQANQPLPVYQQNQFGGSLGGPIKKDKLLFFFNYQGLRARQTQNALIQAVPASYAEGNFSVNPQLGSNGQPVATVPIYNPYQYDPTTGLRTQFPGNAIPLGSTSLCAPRPTCTDPATLAFLKQWVLIANANVAGTPEYIGTAKTNNNNDSYNGRVDFLQSEKSTLYARYTQTPYNGYAGSPDPLGGTFNNWGSYNAVAHWIESLNSSTVNHFFVAFTKPNWYDGRKDSGIPNVSAAIGLANTSTVPGGPDMAASPYDLDPSGVSVLTAKTNTYQLQDDLSKVRGRHTLQAGVSLIDKRFNYQGQQDDKGVFNFTGVFTQSCPQGDPTCTTAATSAGDALGGKGGLPFADYLLGATANGANPANLLILNYINYTGHQFYGGYYAQDSWRATNKLTVNFGLRYENWTPWTLPRNNALTYDPSTGDPVYALQNPLNYYSAASCYGKCAPLNPNVPRAGYTTGSKNFAPRGGVAYHLFPTTVVRASAGIYYDGNVNTNQLSNLQTGAAPFTLRYEVDVLGDEATSPVPVKTVSTMFPLSAGGATAIPVPNPSSPPTYRFVERHLPTAAVDQWSLDVEQRLGKSWGLDLSYLGSHTIHEFQFEDVNAAALPTPGTPLASETLQQRRLFSGWGQIGTWMPIGWGRYNGLVASFKNSSPWHGLTLISNFQWAKNMVSSHWGYSDAGNQNFRAPYIWAGDYGTAPPARLVFGYSYALPVGRGKQFGAGMNPVLNALVGGWMVNGISTFAKGGWAPVWDTGPDRTGTGLKSMPNRLCNPNHLPGGRTYLEWYNASCFAETTYGTEGNSNIAAFTVPGFNNWDMALEKSTKTHFPKDTGEFQIRLDTFNTFNHTQWASPSQTIGNWSSTTIGRISGTFPARQMQFTLKYLF